MTWREHFAPKIAAVIRQYPADCPERRKALRDCYDAGERRHWPYKAYLDEIARQTGRKRPAKIKPVPAEQLSLLEVTINA